MTFVNVKTYKTGNKRKEKIKELFYFVITYLELLINFLDLAKVSSTEKTWTPRLRRW